MFEIKEHLAAGKTSNGQKMNITVGRLYDVLRELGLKPNRVSPRYLALRQKALELNREKQPLKAIADYFNKQGFESSKIFILRSLAMHGPGGLITERWQTSLINAEFAGVLVNPGPYAISKEDGAVLTSSSDRRNISRKASQPCSRKFSDGASHSRYGGVLLTQSLAGNHERVKAARG
ncbi:MAG TPA: hypothetical protein VF452_19530 [Candidatus Binatia bacterium]